MVSTIFLAHIYSGTHFILGGGLPFSAKTLEIERKCLYCSAQAIENELHFLNECPFYFIILSLI